MIAYDRDRSDQVMGVLGEKMARFYEARDARLMKMVAEDRERVGDRWHKADPAGQGAAPADPAGMADPADRPAPPQKSRDRRQSAGDISLT